MAKKIRTDFDDLYDFVKTNILGYDESQSLSRSWVLRLKGLSSGQFVKNKNSQQLANYSYIVILNAFKMCYPKIKRALTTISFKDEQHKMNYILKIVESELNTVYLKMKQIEKMDNQIKGVEIKRNNGATYKNKGLKISKDLEGYW